MTSEGSPTACIPDGAATPTEQLELRGDSMTETASNAPDPAERSRWQLAYGFRSELDLLYQKFPVPKKPRLPYVNEAKADWRRVVYPGSIDEFLGNPRAISRLVALAHGESPKTNIIISGGEATGKQAFLRLFRTSMESTTTEQRCVFHTFNAKTLPDKELVTKLEDTLRRIDTEKCTPFLIVDGFESVPVSAQQHHLLPFLSVCNTKNTFMVLIVRPDTKKLPEQVKQRATMIHLEALHANDVRTKLLIVCQRQQIGFTREGIEEVLKRCDYQLLPCIYKLHEVFLAHHFVSLLNVAKTLVKGKCSSASKASASESPPFPLSIISLNTPLRRCKLCTLVPPCSHISMWHLFDRVERVRQLYPTRENDPTVSICPSFLKRGLCANTQSIGRCKYAHPRGMHKIDTSVLVRRCLVHTLPLPCTHCGQASEAKRTLQHEQEALEAAQRDLKAAKTQLVVKETERYIFAREQTKVVKWGAARKEYEDKLSQQDTALRRLHQEVEALQGEVRERKQRVGRLSEDVQLGRSKGQGKGQGKLILASTDDTKATPGA